MGTLFAGLGQTFAQDLKDAARAQIGADHQQVPARGQPAQFDDMFITLLTFGPAGRHRARTNQPAVKSCADLGGDLMQRLNRGGRAVGHNHMRHRNGSAKGDQQGSKAKLFHHGQDIMRGQVNER